MNLFRVIPVLSLCRISLPRLITALVLFTSLASAQDNGDDYVNERVMKYDDYIYLPTIRTVQFAEVGALNTTPAIPLNGNIQLELSFDDLDADRKLYTISFVHCNADWTPSDLMISEYITGFYDINIINYSYSGSTLQKYTHYDIVFPSQGAQGNVQFTKSGNYVLYVYSGGEKRNLILCRRFMVYDERVTVAASFQQQVGGGDQFKKQHIEFTINSLNYNLTNPYKDMTVVLMQNNRWENAVSDIKPTFLNGTQLIYSLDDASTFPGGNEFRYFDIRSSRYLTEKVKEIYKDQQMKNHAVLYPDQIRSNKPYLFYNDFNGGYLIKTYDRDGDTDLESDYVYVDFFLPYATPESKGNFYIMGKLVDWRMNKSSMMTYNYQRQGYEATLYLKQGYYNYIYVLSNDSKKGGDETVTEGSFWDTENDYTILVYHRKFGTYYDQLLGCKRLNSLRR